MGDVFSLSYDDEAKKFFSSSVTQRAFREYDNNVEDLKNEWKKLAKIYAPSGAETPRAEDIVKKFKEYGLSKSHVDSHLNAVGMLDGSGPTIAYIATMDDLATVADYVKTWDKPIIESEGKMVGPGTNSSATCASLLGIAKLFTFPWVKPHARIYFVACAQEETALNGMKGFIKDHGNEIDYILETGGGLGGITYGAIGIHWFKIHFKGERGHTLNGGLPNVTRAIAKAVDKIFNIPLPQEAEKRTLLNIAMLGAAKVYNHKSEDGWFSVDLRSMDNENLRKIKEEIFKIADEAAKEQGYQYYIEPYSEIPAGQIPGGRENKLVKMAEAAYKQFGIEPTLSNRAASNCNVSFAKGIPTVGMSGNRGALRDTPNEYANIEPVLKGAKLHFLLGYQLALGEIL
ncbi:M20/M25/M40 family metallo-hydrolase [Candidatus Bathyarchaeota archaeon]|nr:M20/M25/M40 family metallo-hydrolase [Candidatus Bathyarchaeota archaeon]